MKKNTGFEKFTKKKAGAVKEAFKKEKRAFKQEIARDIEKKKVEAGRKKAAVAPAAGNTPSRPSAPLRSGKSAKPGSSAGKPQLQQPPKTAQENSGIMPLNKFIAHAGICARRDAAALVKTGVVTVNGALVTEPGFKVSGNDEVKVNGKKIQPSRQWVYILLNKPKDYITTVEDPQGRKTVLDLVKTATAERVYPVGRLDRNTSGVLLLTNDGDLAQQLSHPKHEVRKIYEVRLDKPLSKADFDKILSGITLEDGFVRPDAVGYADPRDKSVIGIEIHSGRNRIVRRIFEHLHYDVRGLDRVMFAGLTKKNVNRGKWRLLTEKEVRLLKHFNKK